MQVQVRNHDPKWEVLRWLARLWSLGPIVFLFGEFFYPQLDSTAPIPWTDWLQIGLLALSALALGLAWFRERLGGIISLSSLLAFLLTYWIINGEFFPVGGLLWLTSILAPALVFLLYSYQGQVAD